MKHRKRLQYCLSQIEQKLDWGKSKLWKETDFLRLSEIICQETAISISPHTLKRLYGKIKYKEQYNPQRATKDALVKFLGFKNWEEFTFFYDTQIIHDAPQEKQQFWKKKEFKSGVLIVSGLIFLVLFFQWTNRSFDGVKQQQNSDLILFDVNDSLGYVPHTVSVKYNITRGASDSFYVDFDFTHPVNGPDFVKLKKERSTYNYTYQVPGYYHLNLQNNGRELAANDVLVMSKNWNSYFFLEGNTGQWLDNKIQSQKRTGYLYYSPEYLAMKGFNLKTVFFTDHQLFKKFEINGDNFEMKVRFKNSEETGGITCYDFLTNLYCKKNLVYFSLMEKGCSGYSGIKVGNTEIKGVEENLSSFTFNNKIWNIFHVVVKEKKIRAYMNNELIYSSIYQGLNGEIVGLEHLFKGTGKLDYVFLKDLGTKKEFFEDFN
jgi:hypothetical protein